MTVFVFTLCVPVTALIASVVIPIASATNTSRQVGGQTKPALPRGANMVGKNKVFGFLTASEGAYTALCEYVLCRARIKGQSKWVPVGVRYKPCWAHFQCTHCFCSKHLPYVSKFSSNYPHYHAKPWPLLACCSGSEGSGAFLLPLEHCNEASPLFSYRLPPLNCLPFSDLELCVRVCC